MKKQLRLIGGVAILLILLGGAFYFYQAKKKFIEEDYQAVFLDNGQVYFGKIRNVKSTYVTLTDVYYFGPSTRSVRSGQGENDDVVLVKLGSEVHGPTDEMKILRDHILFIETLADDSRVIRAIREYENNE